VGENPSEFEFFVDPEEGVPRYRRDRRKFRKEKQRLGGINRATCGDGVGLAGVFGGSQPPPLGDGLMRSQQMSQSQSKNQGGMTMSQVEKGKHGGRKQKKRRTGF